MALSWQQNVYLAQNEAFFSVPNEVWRRSFEQLFVCKTRGFLFWGNALNFRLFLRPLKELLVLVGKLSLPLILAGFTTRFQHGGKLGAALFPLMTALPPDEISSTLSSHSIPVPFLLFSWKMPVQTPLRTRLRDKLCD